MELSNEAREAQREYNRQYYAKHKEAVKERKRRYWERKALMAKGHDAEAAQTEDPNEDSSK